MVEFKDKDGYKPNVKVEYVDDNGRMMTPKEAFRYLSHRFHGKGSGKRKTEKRSKKVEMEQVLGQLIGRVALFCLGGVSLSGWHQGGRCRLQFHLIVRVAYPNQVAYLSQEWHLAISMVTFSQRGVSGCSKCSVTAI